MADPFAKPGKRGKSRSETDDGQVPRDEAAARRWCMIAEAAYFRAAERGFAPGQELDDWLQAEKDIDAISAGSSDR